MNAGFKEYPWFKEALPSDPKAASNLPLMAFERITCGDRAMANNQVQYISIYDILRPLLKGLSERFLPLHLASSRRAHTLGGVPGCREEGANTRLARSSA